MIIYQSVFGWISTILTVACLVWCIGLALFVIVKSIVNKIKAKKEMKKDLESFEKLKKRKFGTKKND